LAESLAALRGRPLAGLEELNEASESVLCTGNPAPLGLIHTKLIVGEVLGEVPEETPTVPLQQDLQRQQKSLRLPASAGEKVYDFDLRQSTDLARSHLLHRLTVLGIGWGEAQNTRSSQKGTFHEVWRVRWTPELSVAVIEAARWGNTVADAATAFARHGAEKADGLATLTALLERAMLADLPGAIEPLLARLQAATAAGADTTQLMAALPPLASVMRYGNVRKTDMAMVAHVIDGLIVRICVGLPAACASLDDDAAGQMLMHLNATEQAVSLLDNAEHTTAWRGALRKLADQQGVHGLVAGRCCRILIDTGSLTREELARRMSLALAAAIDPAPAAAWLEGFLGHSGLILLHDETLWTLLDEWVTGLSPDHFTAALPLLRRTFVTFAAPERRQMGERVKRQGPAPGSGASCVAVVSQSDSFDHERARAVLPLLEMLLGTGDRAGASA
jgi:hypothetical protein